MVEYRFTHDGVEYSFPTERAAKIEAFRLTGKIGAVVISAHYPMVTTPPPLKVEHKMTLVRWIIALLLFLVVGLAVSTTLVVDMILAIIFAVYVTWPLFAGVAFMYGVLRLIEWWDKKRFADDDWPDMGGAA